MLSSSRNHHRRDLPARFDRTFGRLLLLLSSSSSSVWYHGCQSVLPVSLRASWRKTGIFSSCEIYFSLANDHRRGRPLDLSHPSTFCTFPRLNDHLSQVTLKRGMPVSSSSPRPSCRCGARCESARVRKSRREKEKERKRKRCIHTHTHPHPHRRE